MLNSVKKKVDTLEGPEYFSIKSYFVGDSLLSSVLALGYLVITKFWVLLDLDKVFLGSTILVSNHFKCVSCGWLQV